MLGAASAVRAESDTQSELEALSQRLNGLVERCRGATVGIAVPGGSMGSGVIVDESGLVLTAAHVLPEVGGEVVVVLADGKQVKAKALGVNRTVDSGMARITDPGPYTFSPIAEPDSVWEGDWVVAFGHGGGIQTDRPAPMRLGRALHISARSSDQQWITTDCTVISGDSGGPLFNLEGKVIGIHSNIGMSVLVNRHVPISAYLAQWDALLQPQELTTNPEPVKSPIPGLESLPDDIEREFVRRISAGDDALKQQLESRRQPDGLIALAPEDAAKLLGREDLLEQIRDYQQRIAERQQRAEQIEQADAPLNDLKEQSDVSKQSIKTRMLILEKKRERLLEEIGQDMRRTHGKIADHVLARFEPSVSLAGPVTAQIICRGQAVALGTVVREDGYIVTKASELVGPVTVRLSGTDYAAMTLNGSGPDDLALLKIPAQGLTAVRWADQTPAIGSLLAVPDAGGRPMAIAVVGVEARTIPPKVNNLVLDAQAPKDDSDRPSAAQMLSARGGKLSDRRTDFPQALTHDAVIWAQDIGGPVINLDGEAVGINIARYGRTATYALPADYARQVIQQLLTGR